MKINTLAKLTLIGLGYIYTTNLIDTIYHGIFRPFAVAGTVVGLNVLAGLVQFLFFIALYRQFVPEDRPTLMIASWFSIIGSAFGLLPKLLGVAVLFQSQPFFFVIPNSPLVGAFCPWLSAVLLFAFSLSFFFDYEFRHVKPLKIAFAAGSVGWFIMASAQTLVLINYLSAERPSWLSLFFSAGPSISVIVFSFTFLGLSIFYLAFARVDTQTVNQRYLQKTYKKKYDYDRF